ncbi:MAG: hypothetical protein KR126chlam2_01211 [Chlamydiae bacterium]|nr:hypothetical protein [Chlamydiota bacterium]
MTSREGLSVAEALENLTILADAESLEEIEVTEDLLLISHRDEKPRVITWIQAGPDDQTIAVIKETFRVVHKYLEKYYSKLSQEADLKKLVDGVNIVMVLVGEATKKLDHYSAIFKERVTEYKEYKDLQGFYRNKVVKETFKQFAKTPLPKEQFVVEPELEEGVEDVAGIHILNDIDVIKRDHLYELFFLKNEAGHRFYSYELARNIKLACDFGEYSEKYFGEDPLLQITNWEDKDLQILSKSILEDSRKAIDKFYKEALKYKEMDLVVSLHNSVMALMLATNPRNLIRQFSPKGCSRYFNDFHLFMREVLDSREYQKLLIYGPVSEKPFFVNLLDLVDELCLSLFMRSMGLKELNEALKKMVGAGPKQLSEFLAHTNHSLTEILKKHPSGPIFKTLDLIMDEEEERIFDPLLQSNIPEIEGFITVDNREIQLLRMACPIKQEAIHRAVIADEFVAFLRAYKSHKEGRLLLINYQDRTSWKEHARCAAIEELAHLAEFADTLTVVTLSKDTDFYHQSGLYHELKNADEFIRQFEEHLGDESGGYYFPSDLKEALFPNFIGKMLTKVHKVFFKGKKSLSHRERLDFIELTYRFIELKLIELVSPDLLTMTSKDGLDIGGSSSVGLLALLGAASKKKWSAEEFDQLRLILFGPTLMIRERVIDPDRFDRLYHLIHRFEESPEFAKEFGSLCKLIGLKINI